MDFYRNIQGVLEGREESRIKIPEVRRVLAVMEAARLSSEIGKAVLFE